MKSRTIIFRILSYIGAAYVIFSCCALAAFIISNGLPTLKSELFFADTPPLDAIFGLRPVWDGIWPAMAGTLCLVVLTMLMATVPAIGCGIYLARFAHGRIKSMLSLAIDMIAGVPSIVMGLFGFVLILLLRRTVAPDATTCIAVAALCLAILVLPAITVTTRSSIESLPEVLELTGASLGFSENQILRHLLLPAAARGIFGGIILGAGRAAEDTAVIMLTGVVVNSGLPAGLAGKFEALPFLIYYTAAQYMDESELMRGFGASLVLLILSALLAGAAGICRKSMERRWKGLK
ncbi:MAG: ABC transporter permease subunit [Synergistes sp.]|nr:ABC transporter permease subunit [Synergistes sp.]